MTSHVFVTIIHVTSGYKGNSEFQVYRGVTLSYGPGSFVYPMSVLCLMMSWKEYLLPGLLEFHSIPVKKAGRHSTEPSSLLV